MRRVCQAVEGCDHDAVKVPLRVQNRYTVGRVAHVGVFKHDRVYLALHRRNPCAQDQCHKKGDHVEGCENVGLSAAEMMSCSLVGTCEPTVC